LLLIEAANSFWKKVKRSELLILHSERHLADLPRFFQQLHAASDLVGAALEWSFRLRHPVYDCLYLALAVREDCKLVTADEEFEAAVSRAGLGERLEPFS